MKHTGMLHELLYAVLCMSLALSIAVPCMAQAERKSRDAYATDLLVPAAETLADAATACGGDVKGTASLCGGYVLDGCAVLDAGGGIAIYEPGDADGWLGTGTVTAYGPDGAELFVFPVTWQEGGPYGK